MATFSKLLLSGSTGGRPIKVAATASPGTTVHTTGVSATTIDEIWLYATNTDTTDRKLTVEFGDTTSPDDLIELTVKAESGLVLLVPGLPLVGTGAAGRVVRAFAASANVVTIVGYVNRIVP
jgi:hypothetical protein